MAAKIVPPGPDRRLLVNLTDEQMRSDDADRTADRKRVVAALLRQLRNGADVGEFLLDCVTEAQRRIEPGYELTDNRPGSWEADLLNGFVQHALAQLEREERHQ